MVVNDTINERESLTKHEVGLLETFISTILARSPDLAGIALTAVAGGAAEPIARRTKGNPEAEAVGTKYVSTRQAMGAFEGSSGPAPEILFDMLNDRVLPLRGRGQNGHMRLRTAPMPQQAPSMVRDSLSFYRSDGHAISFHQIE
jgi:hypothetical protein